MGDWVLNDAKNALLFRLSSGASLSVSSVDIFRAEFHGLSSLRGEAVARPKNDLPGLVMSAAFARFRYSLESTNEGICLRLTLDKGGRLIALPKSDQIIVDNHWFAVDTAQVEKIDLELSEKNIAFNCPLDTSQILWLLWEWSEHVESELGESEFTQARSHEARTSFSPDLLKAKLYDYQITGSAIMARNAHAGIGTILADEMGLGKTMQILYLVADLAGQSPKKPALIVVLASTVANWERELAKFAPQLQVYSHVGPWRSGDPSYLRQFDVVLCSYDLLARDEYLFESVEFSATILDEAQAIKNEDSQRSLAAKRLSRQVSVAVTGTPIENTLLDLWSILEFVQPGVLGSRSDFEEKYPDHEDAARELSKQVAPFTIRRLVADVASELPERIDVETPISVSGKFAKEYHRLLNEDTAPLEKSLRLRQLCANANQLELARTLGFTAYPKLERTLEILEPLSQSRGKALVFAPYQSTLDLLDDLVQKVFPNMFRAVVDGRKSASERQEIIDAFTATASPGVLFLNPRAAGVGLNIQAANHVIHFAPEWNPAVIAQASARSHRRGQDKPVFVYYLFYKDTIEEVMMNRLSQRRNLATAGLSELTDRPGMDDLALALEVSPAVAES